MQMGRESEVLPASRQVYGAFKFEQTEKAVWKLSKLRHRQQDREAVEGLVDSKDITILRFRLVRKLPTAEKGSLLQRYVGRRYVEGDRAVYTWKICSEGEGIFSGMHCDETGWCILRASADGLSSTAEICTRQIPVVLSKRKAQGLAASEFGQLLQDAVGDDECERASVVQRALLKAVMVASSESTGSNTW